LIAGGFQETGGAVLTAELYDPKTETFAKAGRLADPRVFPTATLLASGKVLIAGGKVLIAGRVDSEMANVVQDGLNTAEFYSPEGGKFACAGGLSFLGALCNQSMLSKRVYQTATLLRNGQVLIAGGAGDCLLYKGRPELYDPALGTFESANDMIADREQHTATLLNDGTVLFAGGLSPCRTAPPVVRSEIYDPNPAMPPTYIGSFSATGSITEPRAQHTAVLLPTGPDAGSVLIAGGSLNGNATAELYMPASGTFQCVGGVSPDPPVCSPSMTQARQGHTATLLALPPPSFTPPLSVAPTPGGTPAAAATPVTTPLGSAAGTDMNRISGRTILQARARPKTA